MFHRPQASRQRRGPPGHVFVQRSGSSGAWREPGAVALRVVSSRLMIIHKGVL